MSNYPRRERTESSRSDQSNQPQPSHIPGTNKGEEQALKLERAGREEAGKITRDARDATRINAAARQPIHPDMPNIPPA
jgi:hypothetical protein